MKKIENILKLIPLFSFLLIVSSSIKLAVFYNAFNINIVDYLNISEYIPLFMDDLHSLLYIGSSMLLGAIFFSSKTKQKDQEEKKKEKKKEKKNLRISHIAYIIILGVIAPIIIYFRFDSWYERLEPIGILFFVLMTSVAVLYSTYKDKIVMRHLFGWLFFLLTVPIVVSGVRDSYEILENKRKVRYEIDIEGRKYSDTNSHTFIGKSNNYIFLYDYCTHSSTIFPIDRVKEIKILNRR